MNVFFVYRSCSPPMYDECEHNIRSVGLQHSNISLHILLKALEQHEFPAFTIVALYRRGSRGARGPCPPSPQKIAPPNSQARIQGGQEGIAPPGAKRALAPLTKSWTRLCYSLVQGRIYRGHVPPPPRSPLSQAEPNNCALFKD